MRNLLEYDDWLNREDGPVRSEYCRWKGVVCRILGEEGDEILLQTPTGKRRVNRDDISSIEHEEQLTVFQQISAPTITTTY